MSLGVRGKKQADVNGSFFSAAGGTPSSPGLSEAVEVHPLDGTMLTSRVPVSAYSQLDPG